MKYSIDQFLFNYNSHEDVWQATTRDNYFELFNGNEGNVLSAHSLPTLVEIIERTGGDKELINNLINKHE